MKKATTDKKTKVSAIGFERLKFEIHRTDLETKTTTTECIPINDYTTDLNKSEIIIVPSGVFESITFESTLVGKRMVANFSREPLVHRERELIQFLQAGKTVIFLVSTIIDELESDYQTTDVSDIDLCKKFLNKLDIQRRVIKENSMLASKSSEFVEYLKKFGTATTAFTLSHDTECNTLVTNTGKATVGLEWDGRLFFLPFHTDNYTAECFINLIDAVVSATKSYQEKNKLNLPSWLNEVKFQRELEIEKDISLLAKKLESLEGEKDSLSNLKGILTNSGDNLVELMAECLKKYFSLNVSSIDEGKDDLKILDQSGKPIALIEVKGIKGGTKREHINQVDSHRERNNLPSELPGILMINSEMSKGSLEEKLNSEIAKDQITHAKNINVLIFRTAELFQLMLEIESSPPSERKDLLLAILLSGGGRVAVVDGKVKKVE